MAVADIASRMGDVNCSMDRFEDGADNEMAGFRLSYDFCDVADGPALRLVWRSHPLLQPFARGGGLSWVPRFPSLPTYPLLAARHAVFDSCIILPPWDREGRLNAGSLAHHAMRVGDVKSRLKRRQK